MKIKPRLPRGFTDRTRHEVANEQTMLKTIRHVYELYGFDPLDTPFVEYTDALGKFLPDQDRPGAGVFSLQDDDNQWMSLRYDLTAPLARYVAQNYQELPKPYRSYRCGWVFRNEKPGPDRFRQFMQFDADTVGASSIAADAEMCMMAVDILQHLGLEKDDFVIHVNNRKLLDGVLQTAGLDDDRHLNTRLTVLRAIDKLDKFSPEEVQKLLGAGRMDASGDFTKGAGLNDEQIAMIMDFVTFIPTENAASNASVLAQLHHSTFTDNATFQAGVFELEELAHLTETAQYDASQIAISPHIVRGLEYYTGPVFEAVLTFEVTNEKGQAVQFGSIGGGGRYDGLVGRFRGENVPATGFSIGVSRLLSALKHKQIMAIGELGPVIVLVMDRDQMPSYQSMAQELRNAGIRAELYLGNANNLGKQLTYADKRHAPAVIIQGSDERSKGQVQIKDLILGQKLSQNIEDNTRWRTDNPAQCTVERGNLVAAVRAIVEGYQSDE